MEIKRVSDISIVILSEDSSFNEITETMIIFGKKIMIISNISYKEGNSDRYESTEITELDKGRNVNPYLLCEDVFLSLKENLTSYEEIKDITILSIIKNVNV